MNITSYMLATGLTDQGMSAWQAVVTVLIGNLIVLIPTLLMGHAGAKHGIPYAVLAGSSFGTQRAKLPALLRATVACGWFGIRTWLGGSAIYTLRNIITGNALQGEAIRIIDISMGQAACFLGFWALQLYFVVNGTESIRWFESWSAPIKVIMCGALVWWAIPSAGGIGRMVSAPSQFVEGGQKAGQFWAIFWPGLTAMVGYGSTLALNIPDFTRFARTQRDYIIGQAVGLPLPMALLSVVSVVVTAATVVIYGKSIWDPIDAISRMTGIGVGIALLVLTLDTMCSNLAANLVGPAYDFSRAWPKSISYKVGGLITATIGILMISWKISATTQGYIITWLIGYSAHNLFDQRGIYKYRRGWNVPMRGS
jgi:NCS1 family nucleobase:cation symporter-1